jgi:amphi-Trp domain-containing protein
MEASQMGDEKTLYKSESERSVGEVVDFLQQLAQWVSERRLTYERGDETVVIEIPENVSLEIEIEEEDAGKKRVKRSLEIEIEWVEEKVGGGAVAQAMASEGGVIDEE